MDGASHNTQNIAYIAWVNFSPTSQLVSSRGACLSPDTNNIVEYNAMIKFLSKSISLGIQHLVTHLDSHLAMLQLNNIFHVQSYASK